MRLLFCSIVMVVCLTHLAVVANDQEDRLRQRSYVARRSDNSTAFVSKKHCSSESKYQGGGVEKQKPRRWGLFRKSEEQKDKALPDNNQRITSNPVKQEKSTKAATIKPPPDVVQVKKEYQTTRQDNSKTYTPDLRERGRNPLLKPRQGIKEME